MLSSAVCAEMCVPVQMCTYTSVYYERDTEPEREDDDRKILKHFLKISLVFILDYNNLNRLPKYHNINSNCYTEGYVFHLCLLSNLLNVENDIGLPKPSLMFGPLPSLSLTLVLLTIKMNLSSGAGTVLLAQAKLYMACAL